MRRLFFTAFLIVLSSGLALAQYQFEFGNRVALNGVNVVDYQVVGSLQYYLFEFTGSIDADPGNATVTLSKTNGNGLTVAYAIVILNEDGSYERSIQFESISNTRKPSVAISSTGEIFVLAPVISGIAFDPSNLATISHTTAGHAIAKYDSNGQLAFSKSGTFKAPSGDTDYHINTKSDGGFVLGMTTFGINDMDFDPGTVTSVGNNSALRYFFLGRYDEDAVLQSQISASLSNSESANIKAMETDADDAVYIYGHTKAAVDLDPSAAGTFSIGNTARDNNYLVKYDASLNFDWGLNLGAGNIAGNRKMSVRTGRVVIGGRTPWEDLYGDGSSGDRDRLDLNPQDANNTVDAVTTSSAGIFLAEYQSGNGSFVTGSSYGGEDNSAETLKSLSSFGTQLVVSAHFSEESTWISDSQTSTIPSGSQVINLLGGFHHITSVEQFSTGINVTHAYQSSTRLLLNASLSSAYDIDSGIGTITYNPIVGTENLNIGMTKGSFTTSQNQTDVCFGESITMGSNSYNAPGTYHDYYTTSSDQDSIAVTIIGAIVPEITVQSTIQNATNGANSGSVTISASGGSGNFEYSLGGGAFSTNNVFNNLSSGTYSVAVKSAGTNTDCFKTVSVNITGTTPPTIDITKEINCFGETADISITATHGIAPYSYSLDGTNFQGSPDFTNVMPGSYTVIARDANGTNATASLMLTEPDELQIINIFPFDVTCFGGADGSLSAAVTGGTQGYTYSLDGVNYQTSPIFNNLTVGSYTYFVKDANGCVISQAATVTTQATEITAFYSATAASACGVADGGFTMINTAGGAGNYEYMIPGGNFQTSPTFSNLAAGSYNVTIKDDNGCTTQISVPVSEPSGINASVNFLDPTCFGSMNGEITITNVTGGSGNYTYSINGTDFQQSNVFSGLGDGSVNVIIKDDQGCLTIKTTVLIEPAELQLSGTVDTDVSCKDGNDGSVTVTASGGTPLYKFSSDGVSYGSFTSQPEVLTGLSAGLNTLYVQDVNGCIATTDLMITEPAGSTISVDFDADLACFGDSDAVISIIATSPIAGALAYSLDGTTFGSASSFTDLAAGDYTAYVKDPNGCIQEHDFTVDQPDLITATLITTNTSCHGGNDGAIMVSAAGGTGNYSYSIDGTSFQSADSFQNLTAGNYTITVKDDNDCTITLTETLSEPAQLLLTVNNFTDPSCNGDGDGSFDLSGTGGTGAYEYSIDGTNFQSSATFSNLGAGTYNFTIRDTNGCTATATGQLIDPPMLSSTVVVNNQVSCFGETDGSLTVTASGGNPGYSYSLDGVNFNNTSGIFDALAAGTYTIATKDSKGCTTASMITITEPAVLMVSATADSHVTCNSGSDGAISGSATGGTAPYMYSIDGVSFQNTATFSGLGAGTLALTVKDANDCIATTSVQITEPTAIDLQATVTPASCHGASDGSVMLTATNGSGAFEYAINGGSFSSNATFTGLTAGEYTFTVKDANGCTQSISPKVGEPDPLTLNFEAVDITCNGDADGQIAGFTLGGTSPYEYSLDGTNFQSGPFSNLSAGSYTLTVKDSQGCTASKVVTIAEPAVLTASTTVVSQVSCHGADDGEASITVTGGSVPYSYSLDGTIFNSSVDLTALAPASYTLTVRDANNCEASSTFTITEPDALTMSIETSSVLCHNGSDGGITVNMAGGTAPYTYAIDGGPFGSPNKFSDLIAGTYTITVKDSQGCTATASAVVSEPNPIVISSTNVVPPLCHGDANVEVFVTASGGTGTLEYSLDGINYQSSNSFTNLTAGTYSVTVRDANSCTASTSAIIADPATLMLSATVTEVLCFGESNGEISLTASGGTGAFEYSLDGTTFQSPAAFTGLSAGDYTVTVKDANGCTTVITTSISEPAALGVTATVVSDNTINVTATGGVGPYEYSLDGTNFQSSSSFDNLANGDYTITVRDANGCTASTSGSLIVTSIDVPGIEIVSAYPNPVSDYLTFSRLAAGDEIRLVSLNGNSLDRTIIQEEKEEYRKDISGIRQKIFLAIVVSKDGRVKLNQKVMKKE
ncbi:MAG: hypothetical protein HEP71_32875 [Roseivirga sp.]|nr:hypothetical protein [Roseivirga sp.]